MYVGIAASNAVSPQNNNLNRKLEIRNRNKEMYLYSLTNVMLECHECGVGRTFRFVKLNSVGS